jgi:hypothetical protein
LPVAALHSGFGVCSTNNLVTSVASGLNSSAVSGIESLCRSAVGGAAACCGAGGAGGADGRGGGAEADGCDGTGAADCGAGAEVCGAEVDEAPADETCGDEGSGDDCSGDDCSGDDCSGAGAAARAALAATLRSSESRASALNTFEQRPQRTNPCATRRSAADTTSVKAHFGQTVYMCCGGVPRVRASLRALRKGAYQNTCCKRLSPQALAT